MNLNSKHQNSYDRIRISIKNMAFYIKIEAENKNRYSKN